MHTGIFTIVPKRNFDHRNFLYWNFVSWTFVCRNFDHQVTPFFCQQFIYQELDTYSCKVPSGATGKGTSSRAMCVAPLMLWVRAPPNANSFSSFFLIFYKFLVYKIPVDKYPAAKIPVVKIPFVKIPASRFPVVKSPPTKFSCTKFLLSKFL